MPRVLMIGHDASRTGAPAVLLNLIRWLREHTPLTISIALIDGGPLTEQFAALAPTTVLSETYPLSRYGLGPLAKVRGVGGVLRRAVACTAWRATLDGDWDLIYANTVASAAALAVAQRGRRHPAIVHAHEMGDQIAFYGGPRLVRQLDRLSDAWLAAGDTVAETLVRQHSVTRSKISVVNEFISTAAARALAAGEARQRLNVPAFANAWLVGGCGTINTRKGVDLLLEIAARTPPIIMGRPVYFVWIGAAEDAAFLEKIEARQTAAGLQNRFHFLPARPDVVASLAALDVFALSSRQDPMPLVALEAAAVGRPVLCFRGTGAVPGLLGDAGCCAVAAFDCTEAAARLTGLLVDADRRQAMAKHAQSVVERHCDVDAVAPDIYERMTALIARRP